MKALIYVVFALLLAGCQRNAPAQPAKEYQMQGEVMALDPAAHLANIEQPVAFTEAVGQFLRASLVG